MAVAEPDWAKIVAVPVEIAVTSPLANTLAIPAFDELHVTLAPLMVAPFWSFTVAVSWDVSPSEVKLRLVAERVIEVATSVGVVGVLVGVLPPSPHAGSNNTDISARHLMRIMCGGDQYLR